MRNVDLEELQDLLRQMPVMVDMHPLSLAFLPSEVGVFEEPWQIISELDSPTLQPTNPMLATRVESALQYRLPSVYCTHDPLTTELNKVLLKRYDFIKVSMLYQSQIADEIAQRADVETIVLMLVDGLSYADVAGRKATRHHQHETDYELRPVLVDGVSITEQGMVRIIGNPPLVQRLFDAGFHVCLGFTYWERAEEPLTDRIFAGFGERVYKVKSFDEALSVLEDRELHNAFVQIVRTGLDGLAYRQRDTPNVKAAVEDIMDDWGQLVEVFETKDLRAWLYLVSDHGILWSHEHNLQVYEFSGADHPRHYEHAKSGEHTLNVEFEGREFAMLEYPYLRRQLQSNEWGVHGGLSFEESLVPFMGTELTGVCRNGLE